MPNSRRATLRSQTREVSSDFWRTSQPWRRLAAMSLLGLWLILASPVAAQPKFDYHESFVRFDRELKAAIEAENVAALALLVKFPLHVNHADGSTISLDGPRALQAQFADVFTPEVRLDIQETQLGQHIIRASDIGYHKGLVWVEEVPTGGEDGTFRIKLINQGLRPSDDAAAKSLKLAFVCETTKHRIVIEDRYSDHSARYRVWNRPKSLLEKPDLELENGIGSSEGTGPCAAYFWEFTALRVKIRVGEIGCSPGNEPAGAIGDLVVTKKDGSEQSWYCF